MDNKFKDASQNKFFYFYIIIILVAVFIVFISSQTKKAEQTGKDKTTTTTAITTTIADSDDTTKESEKTTNDEKTTEKITDLPANVIPTEKGKEYETHRVSPEDDKYGDEYAPEGELGVDYIYDEEGNVVYLNETTTKSK